MEKEYRVECKTIAEHPSQNRKWFTVANAYTPAGAAKKVRDHRPGDQIEILSVWEKVY